MFLIKSLRCKPRQTEHTCESSGEPLCMTRIEPTLASAIFFTASNTLSCTAAAQVAFEAIQKQNWLSDIAAEMAVAAALVAAAAKQV